VGLPTQENSKQIRQDMPLIETERNQRFEIVKHKRELLNDIINQRETVRKLMERNKKNQISSMEIENLNEGRIYLPFIIVNTPNTTVIDCEVSDERGSYFFDFSHKFEIHDDTEILKRMDFKNLESISTISPSNSLNNLNLSGYSTRRSARKKLNLMASTDSQTNSEII